eukprot:3414520-Pyramimonas_sp.AAC.1
MVRMPAWDKETNARHYLDFPINLPHEIFARKWGKDPSRWGPINFSPDDLPVNFSEHEVPTQNKHTSRMASLRHTSLGHAGHGPRAPAVQMPAKCDFQACNGDVFAYYVYISGQ